MTKTKVPSYYIEAKFADAEYRPFSEIGYFHSNKDRKPLAEWVAKFNEVNGENVSKARVRINKPEPFNTIIEEI